MAAVAGIAGMALGTIGTIGGNLDMDKARHALSNLGNQDPSYEISPEAQGRYKLAQNLLNAQMPGQTQIERNIYGNQANADYNINSTATNSSQALAAKAGMQGNTNQNFQNLGVQQRQDYYNRLNNLNTAQGAMTGEEDKAYADRVRKWQDSVNILLGGAQMKQSEWQNVTNLGGMIGSMGGSMGGGGAAAAK
jgi:hypothetical protein